MKKTITILMIAIMILATGALSVFALGDEASAGFDEVVNDIGINDSKAAISTIVLNEPDQKHMNVTVSWLAIEGAVDYTVKWNDFVREGITGTSCTFNDQNPGVYTAYVTAYDEEGNVIGIGTGEPFTVVETIDPVSKLGAFEGYGSVSLYWTPVSDASSYIICKSTEKNGSALNDVGDPYDTVKASTLKASNAMSVTKVKAPEEWGTSYKNTTVFKYRDANKGTLTYYKVYAVKVSNGKKIISETAPVASSSRIEYIKYKFTLKINKKLTSHDGKNKKHTFSKGQTLTASGFGGGKYKFYYKINGKEYYFYCNAIDTKNASAIYRASGDYSITAAENYVNEKGFKSPTKYLIWTSLYTQRTYIFQGSKGKWNCIRDFDCGSGVAKAASPSGEDKELIAGPGTEEKPGKKYSRSGHGRRYYWSPYSSWNSYHSVKLAKDGTPLQTLGYPASNGCIRCALVDAAYIFDLPRHTKVVVL